MSTTTVSPRTIAKDFRAAMDGKLEPARIDAAASKLEAMSASYGATGAVISAVVYLEFIVTVKGGKTFNGKAGGLTTPGGGKLFGDVYTDDLDGLYANTVSFEFQATTGYTSLLFFDSDSNLLGHFQAGAVSMVTGIGGGSGSWS